MKNRLALLAAAAALVCPTVTRAAATMAVGDPKDPGALAQAIQDAYMGGARHIVIRPGTYLMPKTGHTAITLDGWQDATLSAYHVTIILTDMAWGHDAIDIHHCTNLTVEGPLLSQTGMNAYQGRVVAVGKDAAGKPTCDWRPDAGYPVPPATEKGFLGGDVNVIDPRTRLLKIGNGDFYGVHYQVLGDGTFRAQMGGNIAVGDWFVGRYGDAPFKVFLDGSRGCTVRDVTMMRNGFANVREDGGGGNHLFHCVWALGPRPSGATADPLVTNTADGLHSTGADPGLDIENCVFQGVLLDDCIAIHGSFQTITSASGNTLTLANGSGGLRVGDPARISDEHGFFAQATVTALQDNADKTATVTLDRALDVPVGAKTSNPLHDGGGYKIIGNHLGNTRSRGMLLKGDNGLVKNNVIEGCGQAAISLGPEYYWGEADYVQNVTVEGNTIRENGKCAYGGGAILVHGDGAIGNRNIVIRDNRLISNYQGDVDVQWTDGVTLTGNVITGASQWPSTIPLQSPIMLSNCRAVTLSGNVVRHPSVYKPALVAVGQNVTGLANNDAAGIRVTAGASQDTVR